MKIIAFDQSTICSGWSEWIDGKLIDHGTFSIVNHKKYNSAERIEKTYLFAKELIVSQKPDFVMMEQPFYGMNLQGYKTSSQLTGALMSIMFDMGVAFELIEPSSWRKMVGITAGKKKQAELKQMAIDLVHRLYGVECGADEAEAILIGSATCKILKKE